MLRDGSETPTGHGHRPADAGPATPQPQPGELPVPDYLLKHYWWAYVDPRAVTVFERPWLINLILLRNYARLSQAVIDAVEVGQGGSVLQVACAYGEFTPRLLAKVRAAGARLDVVDILQVQLDNLAGKLAPDDPVRLQRMDSRHLDFRDGSQDCVVLFFLMHEQPDAVRRQTLAEAFRVLKPGGRLVILDYARPAPWHPLRLPLRLVLPRLEPFFLDLWTDDLGRWLPSDLVARIAARRTYFGRLYQRIIIEK